MDPSGHVFSFCNSRYCTLVSGSPEQNHISQPSWKLRWPGDSSVTNRLSLEVNHSRSGLLPGGQLPLHPASVLLLGAGHGGCSTILEHGLRAGPCGGRSRKLASASVPEYAWSEGQPCPPGSLLLNFYLQLTEEQGLRWVSATED